MAKKPVKLAKKPNKKVNTPRFSAEKARETLLLASLPHIGRLGWGIEALKKGAKDAKLSENLARTLFPSLPRDALQGFTDLINAKLETDLKKTVGKHTKIRAKVAHGVRRRLELLGPYRGAERKAITLLLRPSYANMAWPNLFKITDIIWHAAGDNSSDWNYYSKRALLAGVYLSTLMFWLNDTSKDSSATWEFLDRRIDNVMQITPS
jgi:ubiquinone biosynthesis protein COQ9